MLASTGDAFEEAVKLIVPRLMPLTRVGMALYKIKMGGFATRFPQAALRLLWSIMDRANAFYTGELDQILMVIQAEWPMAVEDTQFRQLKDFAAR